MSTDHSDATQPKPDLLKLWMGEPEVQPPDPPSLVRRFLQMLAAVGAIVAAVLLAKYAVDVLVILLALLVTGLVLHIVGTRLAESTLLTPGTFAIAASVVALLAYAFVAPADGVLSLGQYLPAPVLKFLTWSEERGWAGRAMSSPPGSLSTPASAPAPAATPAAPPSSAGGSSEALVPGGTGATYGAIPPPSSAPVSVSLSSATSTLGQPVVLMARLGEGTNTPEVRFYDGGTLLGTATVRSERDAQVASLTVTTLQLGPHDILAAIPGSIGLWTQTSASIRHVVTR